MINSNIYLFLSWHLKSNIYFLFLLLFFSSSQCPSQCIISCEVSRCHFLFCVSVSCLLRHGQGCCPSPAAVPPQPLCDCDCVTQWPGIPCITLQPTQSFPVWPNSSRWFPNNPQTQVCMSLFNLITHTVIVIHIVHIK